MAPARVGRGGLVMNATACAERTIGDQVPATRSLAPRKERDETLGFESYREPGRAGQLRVVPAIRHVRPYPLGGRPVAGPGGVRAYGENIVESAARGSECTVPDLF